MNRESVSSSMIHSIGWKDGLLEVEFRNGRVHQYPGVSKEEYEDLKSAGSIGQHFHQHFRDRHNSRV